MFQTTNQSYSTPPNISHTPVGCHVHQFPVSNIDPSPHQRANCLISSTVSTAISGTDKNWRYLPFIKGRFLRPQFQGISSQNMAWNMLLLWMVAKSCITKRMVETIEIILKNGGINHETCWNHRNNGMFTTVFNWCRISQPSTVTYLHWLHRPSKLALRGMIPTPGIPKVCALYLCLLLHEASNHKYNQTQVVLAIQLIIYIISYYNLYILDTTYC